MRTLRLLYLGIDVRALALMRIALGALLLFDLAKRIPSAGVWLTNGGLLPTHRVLWRPASPYQFSFLFSAWTVTQIQIVFVILAAIYLCFLVGYRTRLFHVLSWLALLSLQTRTTFLANGGDYVFCTMLLWTLFMPLGRRWSFDACRSGAESTQRAQHETGWFVSLSVLALRVQLSVIYLFNALNKTGATWKDGSAVHYMLHQSRIATPLAIWVREHAPSNLLRALTYATIVIEYAIPFLILVPSRSVWPRRLAIVLICGLHSNIAVLANLGMFSQVMIAYSLCLLGEADFRWLASRQRLRGALERSTRRVCGVLERTRIYVSERAPEPRQLTPFGSRVQVIRARASEAVVGVLILCAASQLINENEQLLAKLSHQQPVIVRALVDYLRLNQGWSMFAPDAPRTDTWIVVDALTESGRHIDPFNERASDIADPRLRSIPPRLGQNVYFCNYTFRIVDEELFHESLQDWIFAHGRRKHRRDENVVRFDAYVIDQESPRLGQLRPTGIKSRVFLSAKRED